MKKGYTLAETLLAISIAGVLAGYTVSSIVQNNQEKKYEAQTKTAVNTLQDALDYKLASYGAPPAGISLIDWLTRENEFEKAVMFSQERTNNCILANNSLILFNTATPTATNCVNNTCILYADLNGGTPPTRANSCQGDDIELLMENIAVERSRDIVCVVVDRGHVRAPEANECGGVAAENRAIDYLDN